MVVGTGIVFCAQASQLYICTSVPQIEVFKMRISTLSELTSGTGTSSSQRPGSALLFTTACIVFCTGRNYPQISNIHTDYETNSKIKICRNSRNLWTNTFSLRMIESPCPELLRKPSRIPSCRDRCLSCTLLPRSRFGRLPWLSHFQVTNLRFTR